MEKIETPFRPKIVALSRKTEGSYSFDDIIQHEATRGYEGPIITTDFVVTPEDFTKEPIMVGETLVGFKFTGTVQGKERTVINIDHHDSDPRMQRAISSANLAVTYMNAFAENQLYPVQTAETPVRVLVSHYDCDSICAAAILSGSVDKQYWPLLEQAVIAADHTGEENVISDVLQQLSEMMEAAEERRQKDEEPIGPVDRKSFTYSFAALRAILANKPESDWPEAAKVAIQERRENRQRAKEFIAAAQKDPQGIVREANGEEIGQLTILENNVYYLKIRDGKNETREKIATELLYSLLPDAIAIVQASPFKKNRSRWEISIRAGIKGMTLPNFNFHNLNLNKQFGVGGRWNAGASARNGGQENEIEADKVAYFIAEHAAELTQAPS